MNLADVFTFLFVILGFIIVFVGYWLMAFGLFPNLIERCSERMAQPVKATLVGAFTFVPAVATGLFISNEATNALGKTLGIGLVLIAALIALFGAAGLALRIGRGLKSARDEREPWRAVMRGGIVLGFTFVMPFLGTFVLMPFAFISGAGAFVLSRSRKALRASVPQVELPPPMPTAIS
jgi:uncharacterized membrane protein